MGTKKSLKWPFARMLLAVAGLAVAVIVTVAVVGADSGLPGYTPGKMGPQPNAPLTGTKGHVTCDLPGQPKCPTPPDQWIHVASGSPSDIMTALQSAPIYMSPPHAMEIEGTSSFDAPVLVLPATTEASGPLANLPHLVIRAAVNGTRMVTYDVIYDQANQRIQLSSIGFMQPDDPAYGKPFPFRGVSAASAQASLKAAKGLSLAASAAPQLVFFAGDEARTFHRRAIPPHGRVAD